MSSPEFYSGMDIKLMTKYHWKVCIEFTEAILKRTQERLEYEKSMLEKARN